MYICIYIYTHVQYLNFKKQHLKNGHTNVNPTPSHQPNFSSLPVVPCLANAVAIYVVTAHVVGGKSLHPINQRRLFDDVHLSVADSDDSEEAISRNTASFWGGTFVENMNADNWWHQIRRLLW